MKGSHQCCGSGMIYSEYGSSYEILEFLSLYQKEESTICVFLFHTKFQIRIHNTGAQSSHLTGGEGGLGAPPGHRDCGGLRGSRQQRHRLHHRGDSRGHRVHLQHATCLFSGKMKYRKIIEYNLLRSVTKPCLVLGRLRLWALKSFEILEPKKLYPGIQSKL